MECGAVAETERARTRFGPGRFRIRRLDGRHIQGRRDMDGRAIPQLDTEAAILGDRVVEGLLTNRSLCMRLQSGECVRLGFPGGPAGVVVGGRWVAGVRRLRAFDRNSALDSDAQARGEGGDVGGKIRRDEGGGRAVGDRTGRTPPASGGTAGGGRAMHCGRGEGKGRNSRRLALIMPEQRSFNPDTFRVGTPAFAESNSTRRSCRRVIAGLIATYTTFLLAILTADSPPPPTHPALHASLVQRRPRGVSASSTPAMGTADAAPIQVRGESGLPNQLLCSLCVAPRARHLCTAACLPAASLPLPTHKTLPASSLDGMRPACRAGRYIMVFYATIQSGRH